MTNKVKDNKARLNSHRGKQVYGANYFNTYAPVATWFAIYFMILLAIFQAC